MAARGRRNARRILLQALYQMQISGHSPEDLAGQFSGRLESNGADIEYFDELLKTVTASLPELDSQIESFGDIPAAQMDPVEKAVLWIAFAELSHSADVPTKVVINEAIELTKTYGAEGGYKYVNGVVDKAAASLR